MADRRDGLVLLGEMPDQAQHSLIQPEILRSPSTRQYQPVIVFLTNLRKRRIQREIVPPLLRVGLVALEVVNRGAHLLARFLSRTHGVHRVPHHLQRLKRHHRLVVLGVIAHDHQQFRLAHVFLLKHSDGAS